MRALGRTNFYNFVKYADAEDIAHRGMIAAWALLAIGTMAAVWLVDFVPSGDADLLRLFYDSILPSWPSLQISN